MDLILVELKGHAAKTAKSKMKPETK
jgi:hypothetical protein